MQTNIRKIGNSIGAIIPSSLLKKLKLTEGDKVSIEEVNGQIVISAAKPIYKLSELIAKCDPEAPFPEEIKQWDEAEPVSNEVW